MIVKIIRVGGRIALKQFRKTLGPVSVKLLPYILPLPMHTAGDVMETVDSEFRTESLKYVDDLTCLETLQRHSPMFESGGPDGTTVKHTKAVDCETDLKTLGDVCRTRGLKVNESKTQLLAISPPRHEVKTWIEADGKTIESEETLKLLGFVFSQNPNVDMQIENLVKKSMSRLFVLRYYAKFMRGNDLKKLYCALVRSVLEYSSVTYHSMVTKYQENQLENVQKLSLIHI